MNKKIKKKKTAAYQFNHKEMPSAAIHILKARKKMAHFQDRLLIIAQWDRMLRLPLARKILSPIVVLPGIISIFNTTLIFLTRKPYALESHFQIIDQLLKFNLICLLILKSSGLLPFVPLILLIGIFQLLQKDVVIGSEIRSRSTRNKNIALLWNYYVMYNTTKYFPLFLQTSLRGALLLSVAITIMWLLGINRFQKSYGSFNPEQLLKRNERK